MKHLSLASIFAGVFALTATQAFSQASCGTASTLTVGGGCSSGPWTDATVSDVTVTTCGSSSAAIADGWVKFTATSCTSTITFTNTSSGGSKDAALYVYSGACGSLTNIGCADANGSGGNETATVTTTSGSTYYVRVVRRSGSTGSLAGNLCVTDGAIYTVPASGNNSITTCCGTIMDPGGTSDYAVSSNGYTVINPAIAGNMITLTFSSFTLECCCDYVYIYDGSGTGGSLLWSGNCTTLPPLITSTTGPLTIQFTSDASVNYAGFAAAISCGPPCTPPAHNAPCGALALTLGTALSTNNTCTDNVSEPTMPTCWGTGNKNTAWYKFTAPASGSASVTVTPGTIVSTQFAVYSGACGSLTALSGACSTTSTPMCLSGLTPGATYYIVVDGQNSNTGAYTVLVQDPSTVSCTSLLGTGVTSVGSLPYSSGAGTTCGAVNDLTSSNMVICGYSYYYDGEDRVWVFTPTTTGQITCSVASTGTYVNLSLYNGCPITTTCTGTPGTCVAYSQGYSGNESFCCTVTAGVTYYLVMDSYFTTCNAYTNVSITAPSGIPPGTTCSNPVNVSSLPYTVTGETTLCYGDDYNNSSTGSCGTLYESGEDKVYKYVATGSECIGITLSNGSTSQGFQVYSGCPGTAGTTCLGSYGGSNPLNGSVVLPSAGTYYIVVDCWSTPSYINYDLAINSFGSGPSNDLPCSATTLTLGSTTSGDNTCSGSASEPTAPTCWYTGNNNSVWYKVTATSTSMKVRTFLGTLTNTQIAVYSGTCGSLTEIACDDNGASCGLISPYWSDLTLTGLTSGTTYYVRVDGYGDLTGTFDIEAIDGSSSYPTIAGMDCSVPNPVCLQQFTVADPGYAGYGSTCDLPTTYCLASGEKNIVWYTIPINANGNLIFDIVPNDFNSTIPSSTDYDFAVWKIGGSGSYTCAQIAAGTATPAACNYSGLGVTGVGNNTTGNAPASLSAFVCPSCGAYSPTPYYDASYEPRIGVSSGDVYLLAVSNFSNSTSGFAIDFLTSPVGYTGTTTTSVTWTGGTSTAWNLNSNWGGCNYPTCSIDANIVPLGTQPIVTGTMTCRDLNINSGATLTLAAGSTLIVCGNVTNNGNIVAAASSTILFNDNSTTHQMTGSFVGADKLGNLTVTDVAGGTNCTVTLNSNLDLGGNFTTSNSTSIFNTSGKYMKVAGNFVNNNGATTFTNVGTTGTLEFNGTAAQTYTQGSSLLDLNFVLMNHTGTGLSLLTDMNIKTTTGTLTLTAGKIVTTTSYQVYCKNTTTSAVSVGNATSYVEGYLRRAIAGTGAYEFPVGTSLKGYQRATINFTTATTTINNLRANFNNWAAVPGALGVTDCTVPYNLPFLDNGYWTINAFNSGGTQISGDGIYTSTLWPRVGSYTNAGSAVEWTVAKDPTNTLTWSIVGTCNMASTVNQVIRNVMTGFSGFAVEQSTTSLPIELVSFTGQQEGKNHLLQWTTASEVNNQWIILEQCTDGVSYKEIYRTAGQSLSNTLRNYEYLYHYPDPGINYYRLKQIDENGNYSYSDVVTLNNTFGLVVLDNLYPNPTSGDIQFDLTTNENATFNIMVFDVTGQLVMQKNYTQETGRHKVNMELSQLSRGVYTLRVEQQGGLFRSVNRVVRN